MKVAVIGAGRIGGTIGARWHEAGQDVVYGLRDTSKKEGSRPVAEALKAAATVLLAIPGSAVVPFAREHAKDLDGKVVIDATNNFGGPSMNSWPELSGLLPKAHLYRAFNTYGWDVFDNPSIGGQQPDLFYAGPDGARKNEVERLIAAAGVRPVWVGGPEQVDVVDGVLRLWFTLAQKRGRRIAFRLIAD